MNNISKTLILISIVGALQSCTSSRVEDDFSYEKLSDSVDGSFFRNRKFDYARVKVIEAPSLKIPKGLNGSKIKPRFVLPGGETTFAGSSVAVAEKEMLPPGFEDKFDINKVINEQIAKVAISVVYDKKGALKLVFREPLVITLELLNEYFNKYPDLFKVVKEDNRVMGGTIINVIELKDNITYVIKVRKVDDLSSLVTVTAVFNTGDSSMVGDYLLKGDALLTSIRKSLDGDVVKHNYKTEQKDTSGSTGKWRKNSASGLGGLASGVDSIGFGSYDRTIKDDREKNKYKQSAAEYNNESKPVNTDVYVSDAKPKVLGS